MNYIGVQHSSHEVSMRFDQEGRMIVTILWPTAADENDRKIECLYDGTDWRHPNGVQVRGAYLGILRQIEVRIKNLMMMKTFAEPYEDYSSRYE